MLTVADCRQVRLLLGLGRYEEMAYVFELLLREDRLERLLTAGVSDPRLGTALRRHLVRHHPEDTARLRLVTGRSAIVHPLHPCISTPGL